MGRLSLVIGDRDESYLESLNGYLMEHYAQRFRLHSFTKPSSLQSFLSESDKCFDILLATPEFYENSLSLNHVRTPLLLSPGRILEATGKLSLVNKYQNVDRLVGDILHLYNQENKNEILIPGGHKNTRVFAIYSPAGGAGKTSIATGLSIHCAEQGAAVFYLSLEDLYSAADSFKPYGDQSLSNVFFHLKEKDKTLGLKMEGIRCVDPVYGVHFFAPPESVTEVEEVLPSELEWLLKQLKSCSQYDIIFIDMSSSLTKRNLALLEASDKILLVSVPGASSEEKQKAFLRELDILSQRRQGHIADKIIRIHNKVETPIFKVTEEDADISDRGAFMLPWVQGSMKQGLMAHKEFYQGIHAITQIGNEESSKEYGG